MCIFLFKEDGAWTRHFYLNNADVELTHVQIYIYDVIYILSPMLILSVPLNSDGILNHQTTQNFNHSLKIDVQLELK